MKNLVLLVAFIFLAASSNVFSVEVPTKDCMKTFETNKRSSKNISNIKKKEFKAKVKSQ